MNIEHNAKHWNHSLCRACYEIQEPGRYPARLKDFAILTCCSCGTDTAEGIYYRQKPGTFLYCSGEGDS